MSVVCYSSGLNEIINFTVASTFRFIFFASVKCFNDVTTVSSYGKLTAVYDLYRTDIFRAVTVKKKLMKLHGLSNVNPFCVFVCLSVFANIERIKLCLRLSEKRW